MSVSWGQSVSLGRWEVPERTEGTGVQLGECVLIPLSGAPEEVTMVHFVTCIFTTIAFQWEKIKQSRRPHLVETAVRDRRRPGGQGSRVPTYT